MFWKQYPETCDYLKPIAEQFAMWHSQNVTFITKNMKQITRFGLLPSDMDTRIAHNGPMLYTENCIDYAELHEPSKVS